MEGGAARDPRGVWGDPPAGPYIVPQRLRPGPSPHGAASQQPVLILQELPGPGAAPAGPPRVRGDLMELMMIQNSQMHQVVMNSLAMAALMSFSLGPSLAPAQVLPGPEEEEEAVVFHHHYIPIPSPVPIPAGLLPIPGRAQGPAAVRFLGSLGEDEGRAVPPPPPPSATGTVGPQVPPAAEYYGVLEERPGSPGFPR